PPRLRLNFETPRPLILKPPPIVSKLTRFATAATGQKWTTWLLVTPTMRRADRVHLNFFGTSAHATLKNLRRRVCSMAKLVYGLMQSLDGYVDHLKLGPPRPALSRHFNEQVRHQSGCMYGRGTYEIMRYWEEDRADWDAEDHEFAAVWRRQLKWVVSRSL